MGKKNFTDSLLGSNRSKKLDMLVPSSPTPAESTATVEAANEEQKKETPAQPKPAAPKTAASTAASTEALPKKKRGRKKKEGEKDSFFYTVNKDFLFEVKAAAFWDRRDISEFITMALKHYMYEEMGESEIRRAVREYRKRMEEAI